MAPKGNAKAVAAREAKAGREAEKKAKENQAKEAAEEAEWSKGAKKNKGEDKAAKAAAARDAKAARDAALAEEEAAMTSKAKSNPKAGAKKPAKISTPAAKASPGSSIPGTPKSGGAGGIPSFEDALNADPESFSASNLDDALSLLSLVNEKQDKASLGSKAASTLDAHPERRFKAAFAAYKERELPILRKDQPGLRLQQYEELMFKNFKKSPENPFNQATVAFDASKEEKLAALKKLREETENRLRDQSN